MLFKPGGDIDGVACDKEVATAHIVGGDDLTCIDAHAQGQPAGEHAILGDGIAQGKRG